MNKNLIIVYNIIVILLLIVTLILTILTLSKGIQSEKKIDTIQTTLNNWTLNE